MAEVRTVKIKDLKKAKRDAQGNLVLGEDGLPQYSTRPEDYRVITEADYEANQRDERVARADKYELFDVVRVQSGNDPVQEEARRNREAAAQRHREERTGAREPVEKSGADPLNSGQVEAGERVSKKAAQEQVKPVQAKVAESEGDDKGKPKK